MRHRVHDKREDHQRLASAGVNVQYGADERVRGSVPGLIVRHCSTHERSAHAYL